jgi:subtilisin-like proprotein convertase family protein
MKRGLMRLATIALSIALASAATATAASGKTVTKTGTFDKCVSINSPILDHSTTSESLFLSIPKNGKKSQSGTVTAISAVGTRITHTADGDLSLSVVSPAGKAVALAIQRGSSQAGFGAGASSCAGSLALFGDSFGATIPSGGPDDEPVVGQIRPEQPLSAFVGGPARGFWTLVVEDCCTDDVGSLNAVSLSFTYSFKKPAKRRKGAK